MKILNMRTMFRKSYTNFEYSFSFKRELCFSKTERSSKFEYFFLYCEQFFESEFRIHIEHFLSTGWTLFKETLNIFFKYAELFLNSCWTKFLYMMNIFLYTLNIFSMYGEQYSNTRRTFFKYDELLLNACWTKFLYMMNIFYTHWTFFQCMVNIFLQYG